MTIHLQGIGSKPAHKASEVKPGDTLVWNYGYTSHVQSVTPSKSGKSITIITDKGRRRMSVDSTVCII